MYRLLENIQHPYGMVNYATLHEAFRISVFLPFEALIVAKGIRSQWCQKMFFEILCRLSLLPNLYLFFDVALRPQRTHTLALQLLHTPGHLVHV